MRTNCTLSMDASVAILSGRLAQRQPFLFARFGDGAVECINGSRHPATCDGERYGPELGARLLRCLSTLRHFRGDAAKVGAAVYLGDWRTAVHGSHPQRQDEWEAIIGPEDWPLLHFEALLLNRETPDLQRFYQTVKSDPRRKLMMGPYWVEPAARALGAKFLRVSVGGGGLWQNNAEIECLAEKLVLSDFEVLLWGAGMAGNIPVVECWQQHPEKTYIALGSALDPLYKGRTRTGQLPLERARVLLAGVL